MSRPLLILLVLLGGFTSGCQMFEWVAPHQLWKLNRQPAIGGEDGYFSIPARPPESENGTAADLE